MPKIKEDNLYDYLFEQCPNLFTNSQPEKRFRFVAEKYFNDGKNFVYK